MIYRFLKVLGSVAFLVFVAASVYAAVVVGNSQMALYDKIVTIACLIVWLSFGMADGFEFDD